MTEAARQDEVIVEGTKLRREDVSQPAFNDVQQQGNQEDDAESEEDLTNSRPRRKVKIVKHNLLHTCRIHDAIRS